MPSPTFTVQENVRLKSLNLAWNGLGQEGGAAVADALMSNQALLELDLTGNRLGLDTAKRMAKVLTSNDSIRVLKVRVCFLRVALRTTFLQEYAI